MIKTAEEAKMLALIHNRDESIQQAKNDFGPLLEVIEQRAKLGFVAMDLKYFLSDELEELLKRAGFKIDTRITHSSDQNSYYTKISW